MKTAGRMSSGVLVVPAYGDLRSLNTSRVILDSVSEEVLLEIVQGFLGLLGTSSAVYERNGDYALGIISSGWCQFLDQPSRNLCGTGDNRAALACGKWHCHESCWTDVSKRSIETGEPVDQECAGGLRLYAVPIRAGEEMVGAISVGYGDPPRDPKILRELAAKYQVEEAELARQAAAYESRPPEIIELARQRVGFAARLIGEMVRRRQVERALAESEERLRSIMDSVDAIVWLKDEAGRFLMVNRYFLEKHGVAGIDTQIGQYLVHLAGVHLHRPHAGSRQPGQLNILADQAAQHLQHPRHHVVQIHHLRRDRLLARKRQQLPG